MSRTDGWRRPLVAVAVLAVAAVLRLPTLSHPLTEAHSFRQTQTAFSAVIYADKGIDLLRPEMPVFGPPWTLPFEFPLYQTLASLLIDGGLSPEVALRGLSLAFFIGTAFVLWLVLSRHINQRTALISLVVLCFSPFALLWSRTSMIEYVATFGAVLFMLGVLEWHSGHGRRWLLLAVLGGTLSSLVKITTAVFWVAPALLTRRRAALVACAVPAVVGLAWSRHADGIKGASPWTESLTSSALTQWNLGGDRLSIDVWLSIAWPVVVWAGLLLLPFGVLVALRRERLVWMWFGIALIGPLLLFTNLFAVHDYYTAAVSPAIAALVGGGLDHAMTMGSRVRAVTAATVTALVVVAMFFGVAYLGKTYLPLDPGHILERAAILRAASPETNLVELGCKDWNPAVMYYANRRGFVKDGDGTFLRITDPRVCHE